MRGIIKVIRPLAKKKKRANKKDRAVNMWYV